MSNKMFGYSSIFEIQNVVNNLKLMRFAHNYDDK